MKHINLVLVFLLASITLTYGQTSQSGNEDKSGLIDCAARFNSFSGQVEVRHSANSNDWNVAQSGMVLYGNDHIRTGPGSSAILTFPDKYILAAKAKTEFIINSSESKTGQLKLMNGIIMANVKNVNNDETLEIDMNYAVVRFKVGTVILESSDEVSTLKVIEGAINFTSKADGKSVEVSDGQFVQANSQGVSTPAQTDLTLEKLEWSHFKTIAAQNPVIQIEKTVPPTEKIKSDSLLIPISWYAIAAICILLLGLGIVLIFRMRRSRAVSPAARPAGIHPNSPSTAIKTCRNCGTPFPEQTKFCSKCGEMVTSSVQPPINHVVATPVCKSCGTVITPGVKFCISCGKAV